MKLVHLADNESECTVALIPTIAGLAPQTHFVCHCSSQGVWCDKKFEWEELPEEESKKITVSGT